MIANMHYYNDHIIPCRASSVHQLNDDELEELKDEDTLILRIIPPMNQVIQFGKLTYNPMNEHTDYGYSKFYSILMYLVSRLLGLSECTLVLSLIVSVWCSECLINSLKGFNVQEEANGC